MTINVWSDSMQHIELLGKPALFSDSRVDRSTCQMAGMSTICVAVTMTPI